MTATVKIYSGLSVREPEARAILPESIFAPPVERGDILTDMAAQIHVVVIIDGRFQQALAVSCGEIMDALRAGMRVYGASSMGALRAAELSPCGMIGHGEIYEHIRAQHYFRDDYLGQIFYEGPAGLEGSLSYIDLHFALLSLGEAGAVSEQARFVIDEAYRSLHFAERTAENLKAVLGDEPALAAAVDSAAARPSQKHTDGLALLRRVKGDLERITALNRTILQSQKETRRFDELEPELELAVKVTLGR